MAVLGRIRSNGSLLLIVIGGAMVAFILGDIFSNRGGGQGDRTLGEIGGQKIDVQVFEKRVNDLVESYQTEFGRTISGAQVEGIRGQIWNQMIREKTVLTQARAAGIQLHKDEYDDVRFGDNILDDFKSDPSLRNPLTDVVDKGKVIQQLNQIQEFAPLYYEIQKKNVIESRTYQKYMNLIKGSLYVTRAEAAQDVRSRGASANFNFILKGYDSAPDSLYTPTEPEVRAYYSQHKNDVKYKQQGSRAFEYVKFPIIPTIDDELAAREYIADIVADFKETDSDSSFVVGNSDVRTYGVVSYESGSLDAVTDSLIMNASVGDVVGPYKQSGSFLVAKVVGLEDLEQATVRHILIKSTPDGRAKGDNTVASALADSILRAVKRNPSVFEKLVDKYSEDPGSIANKGKYENFPRGQMVKEFEETSFERPIGTKEIAKTSFGYHVIDVLGRRNIEQRQIATIMRNIEPSGPTSRAVFKLANDISLNYASADSFRVVAERKGGNWAEVDELLSTVSAVPGLRESGNIVSEVFRMEEIGTLSEPKVAGDNYIVCRLVRIREEGAPEIEDIRERIVPEIIKEKKAAAFVAMMSGKNDINALATELGTNVKSANAVSVASTTITGGYQESEVIGKLFRLPDGQVGGPWVGDQGVYMIQMTNKTGASDQSDYSVDKENLMTQLNASAENQVYAALRDAAGVTDDRRKFY